MKKLFVALMAVLAIVLSGCKRDSSMLSAENHYSKKACFLFSQDRQCRSLEKADFYCFVAPGKAAAWTGVKMKGLNVIYFACTQEEQVGEETLSRYEYISDFDLSSFDGWSFVTVELSSEGKPGVKGDL